MYEVMRDWNVYNGKVKSQDCYSEVDGLQGGVCELNLPWEGWNLPVHVRKN